MSDVIVKLTAENAQLKAGLERAKADIAKFAKESEGALSGLGAKFGALLSFGAIANLGRSLITFGDDLNDTAARLNMSTDAVQGLQGAFEESGVRAQDFDKAMVRLNQSLADAGNNTGTARAAFDALKITWEDISGKSPEDVLYVIADAMKTASDPAVALSAAMDLLGKAGARMIPGLREGSDEIKRLAADTDKLTEAQIRAASAADSLLNRLGRSAKIKLADSLEGLEMLFTGKGLWKPRDSAGPASPIAAPNEPTEDPRAAAQSRESENAANERAWKAYDEGLKEIEDTEKRRLKTEEEITAQIIEQEQAFKKAGEQVAELEKKRKIAKLEGDLGVAENAAQDRAGRMGDVMDEMVAENLKSPDQRRQERRDKGKLDRATSRRDRMIEKDGIAKDARPGAGEKMQEFKDAKEASAKLQKTVEEIKESLKKLATA